MMIKNIKTSSPLTLSPKKTVEKKEELLEERSEKNKNKNSQFTWYFWKLGLETDLSLP